jgi:NAD(P)-dependent dehydrogenase (short-subunit alcohol dehydrogenase family)
MGDQASQGPHRRRREDGRIDGLHNIAGNPAAHQFDGDVVSTPPETWDLQLRSHLLAYAHSCRVAIPLMLQTGGGCIISTSSSEDFFATHSPTRGARASANRGTRLGSPHCSSPTTANGSTAR